MNHSAGGGKAGSTMNTGSSVKTGSYVKSYVN